MMQYKSVLYCKRNGVTNMFSNSGDRSVKRARVIGRGLMLSRMLLIFQKKCGDEAKRIVWQYYNEISRQRSERFYALWESVCT